MQGAFFYLPLEDLYVFEIRMLKISEIAYHSESGIRNFEE